MTHAKSLTPPLEQYHKAVKINRAAFIDSIEFELSGLNLKVFFQQKVSFSNATKYRLDKEIGSYTNMHVLKKLFIGYQYHRQFDDSECVPIYIHLDLAYDQQTCHQLCSLKEQHLNDQHE